MHSTAIAQTRDNGPADGTGRLLDANSDLHCNTKVFHFQNTGLSVA